MLRKNLLEHQERDIKRFSSVKGKTNHNKIFQDTRVKNLIKLTQIKTCAFSETQSGREGDKTADFARFVRFTP